MTTSNECLDCRINQPSIFSRYRDFLLSRDTIIVAINAILLLAGFIVAAVGAPDHGRWLYLGSAVIGGIPLFLLAGKAVILRHDITAGFMASVAMIAAIIIGEYSAAALVVFMFAVGDWLENLTVARANNALQDLAKLAPDTITVIRGGKEVVLSLDQVILGDIVLIRSGERIGVDGVIQSGSASINQSAITGESMPVEKQVGDEVFAGTLVEGGAFEIKVTRVGVETTLGRIIQLVKDARQTQAPVQRIANKVARILVPVTFGIAVLVYLLTNDLTRSITVLVVVCPCALVLATPTAVVAAIGNAAKRGTLVKSGAVIEQIGRIDVVAFDKTGTLTHGQPVVHQIIAVNSYPAEQILAYAASVERGSEHPIGRSITQAGLDKQIPLIGVNQFAVYPGYGCSAWIDEHQVIIGSRSLLDENQVHWTTQIDTQMKDLESQGSTVVSVAVDRIPVGLITLSDTPRLEAKRVVQELKQLGIQEVIMITGDNPRAADRIARELGIDRVYAEVLPQEKLQIIRNQQAQGKKIAFVGDGINDAPALAAADIGIAMGVTGTDVALETADISLIADEIERIPQIIGLSRQALVVIRQNVIFSMSMNLLAVVLGGFGIIGPVFGALLHEASALPVLANSTRLINSRSVKTG